MAYRFSAVRSDAIDRCCRKSRPMSVRRPEMGNNRLRNEEFLNQLSPCGPTSEMLFSGPVSKIVFRQHRPEPDLGRHFMLQKRSPVTGMCRASDFYRGIQ